MVTVLGSLTNGSVALVSLPRMSYHRPRLSQRTVYRRSLSGGSVVFEREPRGKGAAECIALAALLYAELLV